MQVRQLQVAPGPVAGAREAPVLVEASLVEATPLQQPMVWMLIWLLWAPLWEPRYSLQRRVVVVLVAPFFLLDLVAASAAFGPAGPATEAIGRRLLLVVFLRRRHQLLLLLLQYLLLALLLLLLLVAPPPPLLLERSMHRIPQLVRLDVVQHQRIRRMQRIRQLERVVVFLVDIAKPLLQLVLVLALAVPLLQVMLQHRQLLQVLFHRRSRLELFAPLLCFLFVLRPSRSTRSTNLPSRFLGATVSVSWNLVPLMCRQLSRLCTQ